MVNVTLRGEMPLLTTLAGRWISMISSTVQSYNEVALNGIQYALGEVSFHRDGLTKIRDFNILNVPFPFLLPNTLLFMP